MIFDFDSEEFVSIPNFKGGEGHFDAKMHDDGKCKIIYGKVEPGCTSGLHTHEANAEVIYVISGAIALQYDDGEEICRAGQCHYCPEGHAHAMRNLSDTEPAVMFFVVPEHHLG